MGKRKKSEVDSNKEDRSSAAIIELFGEESDLSSQSLSESETESECEWGPNCKGCMSRKRPYLAIPNNQVKELENVIFQVASTPPDMHRAITKVTVHTRWYSKGDKRLIP